LLQVLYVEDVAPAPDAAHLLVVLAGGESRHYLETLAALNGVRPRLRAAIATEITRKRAPDISFKLVVSGGGEEE